MKEEHVTIASAVVVPSPAEASPPRVHIKRRQSTEPPEGQQASSKRARLNNGEDGTLTSPGSAAAATAATAEEEERNLLLSRPSSRRLCGKEEERKRGKRLFGALLGTIGKFQQDSSSARARAGAVKRREVEAKLQGKLKLQTEEIDERKKKEDSDISLRKRLEQRDFDERAMQLRHANLLAQANILSTTASPKLFYLPWKLLPADEDRIKTQIEEAEYTVQTEQREFQRLREQEDEELRIAGDSTNICNEVDATAANEQTLLSSAHPLVPEDADGSDGNADGNEMVNPENTDDGNTDNVTHMHENDEYDESLDHDIRRQSDSGDAGDVIVEAGEDTVIY